MVSPGKLRLVGELADGSCEAYRPTIDGTGVAYPEVREVLDTDETSPRDVLESLTERDILSRDFEGKRYRCPNCESAEMRYQTACPECATTHIVQREVIECEGCDRVAPAEEFETDDGEVVCHGCNSTMGSVEEVERMEHYVCQECGEAVEAPLHALQCPDDGFVCHPTDAYERVIYRYDLGESGEPWLSAQRQARATAAATLDDRGYTVETDAIVSDGAGTDHRHHVYATDDLLEERIVADVHELPTPEDVDALHEAATALDARPLLVSTLGTVSADVADRAERGDVTILTVRDGDIARDYEVTEGLTENRSFLERITTVLATGRR